MKIRIKYNAPVSLTLILLCLIVLALNSYVNDFLIANWFTADGNIDFKYSDPIAYLKFITHLLGHTGMSHFMENAIYVILLGPILEEKYSSKTILGLVLTTAIISGIINAFFVSTYLLGASGIVYLFIVLVTFTNIEKGEFPLSVLVVIAYFVYTEVTRVDVESISVVTHLIGAIIVLLFGVVAIITGASADG